MARNVGKVVLEGILSIISFLIFLVIIFPIFLILFVSCFVWRQVLILFVRLFVKNYVRILNGQNPVVALDDFEKPLCTLVGMGAFDGRLDFQSALEYVSIVVNASDPSGKIVNPEFHQYYEEWLGFLWWKWEKEFNLADHVKLWSMSSDMAEEADVIHIISILEKMAFRKGKSPWEVIVLRNVNLKGVENEQEPKTAIIFRFHHGLADGIAMMQQFMKFVFDDAFEKVAHPHYVKQNLCQQKLKNILAALQLPYEFCKQGITAYDVNEWHLPENRLKRLVSKAWTKRIPIHVIKRVKTIHSVGFTAVLISAISGALRQAMIVNNVKIPKRLHSILPLPWPGHPNKLCNHWSYGFLALPVGTENRFRRLRKCEKYVNNLKRSMSPAVNFAILNVFNLMPTWFIRNLTLTNYLPTVILSNFPGPPPGTKGVGGFPLVDTCFTGGPLRGSIPISVTILSYDGHLRIVVGVDRAVFPTDDMTKGLVHSIEKEFELLACMPEGAVVLL